MTLEHLQKFTFFVDSSITFFVLDFLYSPNHKIWDKPFNTYFCGCIK